MAEVNKFKTESKRLLDLMINSIYTNKEIFLRELISNASDEIDKYHYLSLTDDKLEKRNDYRIFLQVDEKARTISISDNGIGMTHDELNKNLGTIASSGSSEFIKKMKEKEDGNASEVDIIGQFGVGFYSAFMVASKVVVETKSPYSEKGYIFTSTGEDEYTIDECDKKDCGSTITLYLRENKEDENYDEYLKQYRIEALVKKYSDYVRYPIQMYVTKTEYDEKGENPKETTTLTTLNSMVPLWKKPKKDVSEEDLNNFYKDKFNDFSNPFTSINVKVEGNISYDALLFIPGEVPYNLYARDYEKGLALYSKGVFIMDKCKDLVPDYLRFVRGLVDSSDLSLNISREILQQNAILKKISTNIENKVIKELSSIKDSDMERYLNFWKNYGTFIKYGIYESYGSKNELLQDLLVYKHTGGEDHISLKDYVSLMKEGQTKIYYVSTSKKDVPQMEKLKQKGYDVLLLDEDIDEFCIQILGKYQEKEFANISSENVDLLSEDEKKDIEKVVEDNKDFISALKESLNGKVKDVIVSKRLVDSPVCLVSGEGLSFEMEKVLAQNKGNGEVKAEKILEINPHHPIFNSLKSLYETNKDELSNYADLLLDQAMLIEGMPLQDPVAFSNKMCELMIKSTNK